MTDGTDIALHYACTISIEVFPFILLYTFTWVPAVALLNGVINAGSLPFIFTRDMLRNARELW
jgi:hypothetical protein